MKWKVKTVTLDEWKKEGKELFGEDVKNWVFQCPNCKGKQTYQDFEGLTTDPQDVFYYSCIGRFKQGVGCNWTLGGLFQIHEKEVIGEDGKPVPVMEFFRE